MLDMSVTAAFSDSLRVYHICNVELKFTVGLMTFQSTILSYKNISFVFFCAVFTDFTRLFEFSESSYVECATNCFYDFCQIS